MHWNEFSQIANEIVVGQINENAYLAKCFELFKICFINQILIYSFQTIFKLFLKYYLRFFIKKTF